MVRRVSSWSATRSSLPPLSHCGGPTPWVPCLSKVHGQLRLHNRGNHATCFYPLMISKEVIRHPRGIRLEEVLAVSTFRCLLDFHLDKVAIHGRHAMLVGAHPAQATTTKQDILVPLTPSSIHQALSSDQKIAWLRFNTQVEEHGQVTRRLHGYH